MSNKIIQREITVYSAEQWYPGKEIRGVENYHRSISGESIAAVLCRDGMYHAINSGDWVIEIDGGYEVVSQEQFKKKYQLVG